MKKIYLAVHFAKGCFFVNLLTEKLWGLVPKYYLLAGDFYFKPGFYFFLT